MGKKAKMKIVLTRREFILLGSVMCLAGLFFLLSALTVRAGDEVVITVGQREYGRYALDEERVIKIVQEHQVNIVEITGGQVHMQSADCPDKLCVRQGFLQSDLYTIVCLPNRVVVEVNVYE